MIRTVTCLVAVLLLAACGAEPEPDAPVVDIEAGRAIVEARCSGCHGLDGRGKTSEIPNLAAQPANYLSEAMNAYREDRRHHAALQELISGFSEADVANIAAYFASLPPLAPLATPSTEDAAYREGAEIASACFDCHGENGFSTEPGVPSLAGQQPIYLMVSTQEYADGSRGHEGKEAMLAGLQQIDLEKMALFFAAQIPERREPPRFGDPALGEPLTAACGGCHGDRGVSHDPIIPSLAGQEPNYLAAAIRAYRDHERTHEGMITDQSDEEIESIAAWYSVQQAGAALDRDEPVRTMAAKCDRCHGPEAQNTAIAVPSLSGQNRDYLVRVMMQYRDDNRGSSMMHKMSSGFSDPMIEALADHYAAKSPR